MKAGKDNNSILLQASNSFNEARFYKRETEKKKKSPLLESWKGNAWYAATVSAKTPKQLPRSSFSTPSSEIKSSSASSAKSNVPPELLVHFHAMVVTQPGDLGHSTMQRMVESEYKRKVMQDTDLSSRRILVAPMKTNFNSTVWQPSKTMDMLEIPQQPMTKNEAFVKKLLYFWRKKSKSPRSPMSADWELPKYMSHTAKISKTRKKISKKSKMSPLSMGLSALGPTLHSDLKTILEQEKLIQREKLKRKKLLENLRRLKVHSPLTRQEVMTSLNESKQTPPSKTLDMSAGFSQSRSRRKKALIPLADSEKEALMASTQPSFSPYKSTERPFAPGLSFSTLGSAKRSAILLELKKGGPLSPLPSSDVQQRAKRKSRDRTQESLSATSLRSSASQRSGTATTRREHSTIGMRSKSWSWKAQRSTVVSTPKRPVSKKSFAEIRKTNPKSTDVHTPSYQAQHVKLLELHQIYGTAVCSRSLVFDVRICKKICNSFRTEKRRPFVTTTFIGCATTCQTKVERPNAGESIRYFVTFQCFTEKWYGHYAT
ncbi:hypothetical protein HMI55_003132 [Coelomomyces lativittatus]|nr:hypothetical protein HMI55_003132 [Coelomomyces lativittatus]